MKVVTAQRQGQGKMEEIKVGSEVKIFENQQEAEVSEANAKLATKKAAWSQQANMAVMEAEKAVAIREAELQQEVERMNALTKTENFKAQFLSRANVEYHIKLAEARRVEADAETYAKKQAADAALYAKKTEAEGLVAFAEAQGIYIRTLLSALGGNYIALRDYLMIDKGIYKDIPKFNAEAIKGLQPKISIWSSGGASEEEMSDGMNARKGNGLILQSPTRTHQVNQLNGFSHNLDSYLAAKASRPLDMGKWLKQEKTLLTSLPRGPVPPSDASPCTNIPGTGRDGSCP
ncbi:hypothetical protein HAX54_018323 [Datura stramonium]|uniref:Flotillin-like n=1 Tax=Datura stramonium TaxID=4076 RepID=A0ABS8UM11_DATST|nr:hypothetical protein [Datura stramonium]